MCLSAISAVACLKVVVRSASLNVLVRNVLVCYLCCGISLVVPRDAAAEIASL